MIRAPKPALRRPPGLAAEQDPHKKVLVRAGGSLLLGHTFLGLAVFWLSGNWPALARLLSGTDLRHLVWSVIFVQGLLVLLPAVLVIIYYRIPGPLLTGRKAASGSLFLAIAAGISAAVVLQGLGNLLVYALIRAGVSLPQMKESFFATSDLLSKPWQLILVVLVTVAIIPAIIEELFFRGVLFAGLAAKGSLLSAMIWQALAFSLYHADLFFILPPLLAGLILAYIRHQCGRLWPAIVAHLALNLASLALTPLLPSLTQSLLRDNLRQATSLFYASLIAAFVAAVVLIPVLVLLGSSKKHKSSQQLVIFPGDWQFALAIILQIVTIIIGRRLT